MASYSNSMFVPIIMHGVLCAPNPICPYPHLSFFLSTCLSYVSIDLLVFLSYRPSFPCFVSTCLSFFFIDRPFIFFFQSAIHSFLSTPLSLSLFPSPSPTLKSNPVLLISFMPFIDLHVLDKQICSAVLPRGFARIGRCNISFSF